VLRSSSHIATGGEKITQDLAKSLGVDEPIAEYFKRDLNLVNLFDLPKEVMDTLSILKSELQTFYELNKKVAQEPQKVVLTGGALSTTGLFEFLKDFPVAVYIGNSLRRVKIQESIRPYIVPNSNQLSTAIGLAIKDDV
jgi:cell division ATPase FtsA